MKCVWLTGAVTCLIVAAVLASSCSDPSANRFRQVATLLEHGKVGEASAKAREMAAVLGSPGEKQGLAKVLVQGADRLPVSGEALRDEETADLYLQAGELDPGFPGIYIGLERLCKNNDRLTWRPYNIPVKAMILWKDGTAANPGLLEDRAAREAGCYLAKAISDYVLAAEIDPDDLDAHYNAALRLASDTRAEEALFHAREARRIAGERADIANLLAVLGDLEVTPVENVFDESFSRPTSIRFGAADEGYAYVTSFQDHRYVLSQVSLKGGGVKALIDPCSWSVAISADGTYLAYSTGLLPDVACEIRVLELASGKTRPVIRTIGPVQGITWSPDGRRLAFASRDGLVVVDSDGGNRRVLANPVWRSDEDYGIPASPQWSPDGARLLFATSTWERPGPLRIVDVGTGATINLTTGWAGGGLWSPDGRQILYTKMRPGGPAAKVYLLNDLSGNGGDGKCLTEGNVYAFALCWSPDGRRVLINMEPRPSKPGANAGPWLWTCDAGTGEMSALPWVDGPVTGAVWAPDGTILYAVPDRVVGVKLK